MYVGVGSFDQRIFTLQCLQLPLAVASVWLGTLCRLIRRHSLWFQVAADSPLDDLLLLLLFE
jgi:hypothetical protein